MSKDDKRGPDILRVTVHAPNNSAHEFEAKAHERVDKLARTAVEHFTDAGLMQRADCGLVLVEGGTARPLDDTSRLDELDLPQGAVLKLVVKEPKTDGDGR
ncbi:MAG TPA: hypothetical protein VNU26_16325 [Mycobacteriales bacterium]|nr:hypothetical protein [Mycobacteriales bacterium]